MHFPNKKYDKLVILSLLLLQQCFSRFFLKSSPKIYRVIFSGGGVKGTLYPGAFKALEEARLVEMITDASGCSVGALAASFLSTGMSGDEFRSATLNAHFKGLLGERSGFFLKKNSSGCFPISKTGLPFEIWVRDKLNSSVLRFFSDNPAVTDYQLLELKEKLSKNSQSEFTFADLALLNKHIPHKFKKLSIVATTYPEGGLAIFNDQLSPDVDIAKAIRASASLPFLLAPAAIGKQLYMDGGLIDNIPDYFDLDRHHQKMVNNQKEHTLIFIFKDEVCSRDTSLFRALHGSRKDELYRCPKPILFRPNLLDIFKLDYFVGWLLGLRTKEKLTQKIEQSYHRIRTDYPLRTVALGPGMLKATDFAQAQKLSRILCAFGYLDTMHFLLQQDLSQNVHGELRNQSHRVLYYFSVIYSSILAAAEEDTTQDKLLHEVTCFLNNSPQKNESWSEPEPYQHLLHFVKARTELQPYSPAAFSLSRAVEYYHHQINTTQLALEMEDAATALVYQKKLFNIWNFFKLPSKQANNSIEVMNGAWAELNDPM
jgi:predicted acylesterase/phospholipase RssA